MRKVGDSIRITKSVQSLAVVRVVFIKRLVKLRFCGAFAVYGVHYCSRPTTKN